MHTTKTRAELLEELVTVLRARRREAYALPASVVELLDAIDERAEAADIETAQGWAR